MNEIELKFENIYLKLPRDRKSIASAKTMLDMLLNQIINEEEEQKKERNSPKGILKRMAKGVQDISNAAYDVSKNNPIAQQTRDMIKGEKNAKKEQ